MPSKRSKKTKRKMKLARRAKKHPTQTPTEAWNDKQAERWDKFFNNQGK